MPGLLEEPAENAPRALWAAAISAEFLGVFFFGLFGALAGPINGAMANGLLLAVLAYATAKVSGGAFLLNLVFYPRRRPPTLTRPSLSLLLFKNKSPKPQNNTGHLNPAMTVAATATGHSSVSRALAYIGAQVGGNVAAALLHRVLVPGVSKEVGCFAPSSGASLGQAFGWELLMTCLLVLTVYAVAIGEPSFGVAGPLAIGLAVVAAAMTGGRFSGGAMNPARVLGPAIASGGCGSWTVVFVYVGGQTLGGVIAALLSAPLYGTGLELGAWADAARDKAGEAGAALAAGYERVEGAVGSVRERLAGGHQA
jgi:hypothetical protein